MSSGRIVTTPAELQAALEGLPPGLVPTMGALHDGHRSLIARSETENPATVVSIFVNPTQFTNSQDLSAYPRQLEMDAEIAFEAGADLIYAPAVETVYPPGFQSAVDPGGLAKRWEGEFRPGHFTGVATVVTILLNSVRPARAYFGEKDYQQLCLVRQISRDLRLPGDIVGCPTIRAEDGLALSSRNARLTGEERRLAVAVPDTLFELRRLAQREMVAAADLVEHGLELLRQQQEFEVEYLAVVHPETLEPIDSIMPGARVIVAARLGSVRLIDNLDI